jgi:biopolymer transport protein ExbD
MKKRILNIDSKIFEIPRFRLITGVSIGLFYSFAFYSFLYLIREVFRIISVTEDYDLWILTDQEVNFYNLFFAFISVIISQSVCFAFWFDRPRKFFEKRHYRITTIVNDQRVLNWYFLSWFSKLAIVFGIMFGLAFHGGFYVFSFYPDYNYVFILIIIVLYLQTWNTIGLTFKRKSLKWMLLTGVIISIIAFGLSRINLIDYKTINQNYLVKNIHHNYRLELPETNSCERLFRRSLIENIYVVKSKNQNETEPLIIVENKKIDLYELKDKIMDWQSMRGEYDKYHMIYQLHIDKTIKMEFINQVKTELAKSGGTRIAYAVVPKNPEYDIRFYKDYSFQTQIPNWHSDWFLLKDIYNDINSFQNIININQSISGECFINDKPVENDKIKQILRHLITNDTDYIIKFHVNDSVRFSDYFRVVSYSREVVNELRNEYSKETYSEQFDWLDYENGEEVKRKYPLRLFELKTDFKKMINE